MIHRRGHGSHDTSDSLSLLLFDARVFGRVAECAVHRRAPMPARRAGRALSRRHLRRRVLLQAQKHVANALGVLVAVAVQVGTHVVGDRQRVARRAGRVRVSARAHVHC